MKKIVLLLLTVFLFSCTKSGDATIFGTAIGKPENKEEIKKDITVKLYSENGKDKLETTTTNENGQFEFSSIPSGNYYVVATITVDDEIWDSGTTPSVFYVGDNSKKEISLSLKLKE